MRRALTVTALLLAGATSHAQEARKLVIAIYAPNAPFSSGTEQFTFVQRLAQQVTSAAGVPAEGKSFARSGDLETAIKNKQVDYAVIDGVYLAEKGVPYPVLALATTGGETASRWGLYAQAAADVPSLQGKRLSVAATGSRDEEFLSNALLDGVVSVKRFFASQSRAPSIASAVEAVKLNKADAVFAPESESKGMKNIFDAGRVPNPAFCEVGAHDAALTSKVRAAVLAHGAQAAIDGWKAGDAGPYRSLAARMSSRSKRPLMADPEVVKLEDIDVLVPPSIDYAQPDLKNQYWNP